MIFSPEDFSSKNHSCTLSTILSIEHFISQNSGLYSKTELWNALPKKIMYQSYKVVLTYLLTLGKIKIEERKVIWTTHSTFSLEQFEAQHHSSTLTTICNIHTFLEENSGRFSKTQAWKNLPKKVMYQSYKVVLGYLIDSGVVDVVDKRLVIRGEKK